MKRIVSLLAVVSVVSTLACAGEEAWPAQAAESTLGTESQEMAADAGTSDGGTTSCTVEEPPVPPVPDVLNLDTWDFTNTPLMPMTSTTRSMYLVAHASPTDPLRMYVYGIDVTSQRFIFVATLYKRSVSQLLQRAAIDIGRFQSSGAVNASSGISIQIEGPAPPPPPPGIHDPQNYAQIAWQVAVKQHIAAQALHY
jgi:hypothetical protein